MREALFARCRTGQTQAYWTKECWQRKEAFFYDFFSQKEYFHEKSYHFDNKQINKQKANKYYYLGSVTHTLSSFAAHHHLEGVFIDITTVGDVPTFLGLVVGGGESEAAAAGDVRRGEGLNPFFFAASESRLKEIDTKESPL